MAEVTGSGVEFHALTVDLAVGNVPFPAGVSCPLSDGPLFAQLARSYPVVFAEVVNQWVGSNSATLGHVFGLCVAVSGDCLQFDLHIVLVEGRLAQDRSQNGCSGLPHFPNLALLGKVLAEEAVHVGVFLAGFVSGGGICEAGLLLGGGTGSVVFQARGVG